VRLAGWLGAGPLFLLVQAVQVVRLIMFTSKAMQIKMYASPALMKVPQFTSAANSALGGELTDRHNSRSS
jgi:hypothetical protein